MKDYAYRAWIALTFVSLGWFTYSCLEVVLKSMSDFNVFTILGKIAEII